jgi:hypothetical protein
VSTPEPAFREVMIFWADALLAAAILADVVAVVLAVEAVAEETAVVAMIYLLGRYEVRYLESN